AEPGDAFDRHDLFSPPPDRRARARRCASSVDDSLHAADEPPCYASWAAKRAPNSRSGWSAWPMPPSLTSSTHAEIALSGTAAPRRSRDGTALDHRGAGGLRVR